MKTIITNTDKKIYPCKSYCYYPLKNSISSVLSRGNLLEQCEHWRNRVIPHHTLADVYDGQVWQDFLTYEGTPFLSNPHNLGLMLNCDWFQPFELTSYSVGVLYLVILNLPRAIRFKPENILIAGIIPGPSEPDHDEINSYLRPLVKELNSLWTEGFTMSHDGKDVVVRAALLATVCGIPATAKIGGFVGHNSKNACWKCSKLFAYDKILKRVNFSGVELGPPQEHATHKMNALETLSANTASQKEGLELKNGSRFTELMTLPYYNCNRFSIIDPMHNLFLGTSKRILQRQWLETGLISKKNLDQIQHTVQNCQVPIGIGRIPNKIASNFAQLTADEWKNWTLLFFLIALQDILPNEHLECWQKYVSACNIYCSSVVTLDDLNLANEFMTSFFTSAESLYGPSFLTINTHLHLHLQDVYKDYGPCYGYWLFSFERYNYILGKYHTNNLSIEIQLMRKFIQNMHIRSMANSDLLLSPEHLSILKDLLCDMNGGSASETLYRQETNEYVNLMPPFVLHHFDSVSISYLRMSYQAFLPDIDLLEIPQMCRKYKNAMWYSQHLKVSNKTSTCILAKWVGEDGHINTS